MSPPMWGDPKHNWQGIDDCITLMIKVLGDAFEYYDIKEKFGHVRLYISVADNQKRVYRKAYKEALKLHPELATYILNDADYPEYLKGLVKQKDCKHKSKWIHKDFERCGVCQKKFKLSEEYGGIV